MPRETYWVRDDKLVADTDELINLGGKLVDDWTWWAQKPPPDDFWGKIIWFWVVLQQLGLSTITFPAALGAFLLEEAVQTVGMGAYMLWCAKDYEGLNSYIPWQKNFIDGATVTAGAMAIISPITGGAVMRYMSAAKESAVALERASETVQAKLAETDEAARGKELERMKYSEVRLSSSPSGAEIWINGVNTELLTPETMKKLDVGPTVFEVRKYNKKTELWDVLIFEINLEPGRRKEILARIPIGITGETVEDGDTESVEESILPQWIKAEVEGEYAVDGDTFITSKDERVRILGIDAPELGRPFAEEARTFLTEQIEDKKITMQIMSAKPLDVYGRTLAVCKNYKGNIAILLISAGLARVDILDDSPLDRYRYDAAEQTAKTRKVGIWGELP